MDISITFSTLYTFQEPSELTVELQRLLSVLVDCSTNDLRNSYLTTLVEQEINNTVLINQELSKRCIWVQTGSWPNRLSETAESLEIEMNRRLNNLHTELKVSHCFCCLNVHSFITHFNRTIWPKRTSFAFHPLCKFRLTICRTSSPLCLVAYWRTLSMSTPIGAKFRVVRTGWTPTYCTKSKR